MHLFPGILGSNKSVKLQQATVSQCAPIIGYAASTVIHGAQNCIAFNDEVFEYLSGSSVKYVVLGSPFARLYDNRSMVDAEGRLYSNGAEITFTGLVALVDKIRAMGKIPVIFTLPAVDGSDLGKCLLRHELREQAFDDYNFSRDKITPGKS